MVSQIRLGINNAFVAKRWPEPEDWCALIADTLGLSEVQVSFDTLDPLLPEPGRSARINELRDAARCHGLELRSTFTGGIAYGQSLFGHPNRAVREHACRWYAAALDVTTRLGGEMTGGHMGTFDVPTAQSPQRIRNARSSLIDAVVRLARSGAAHGLGCILWELMPSAFEPPHCPEEAVTILTEVNTSAPIPVRLCFDLGHCCAPELPHPGDPEDWLRRLLPWVRMVHLQQTDGKGDRHWPFTPTYCDRGIIDPQRILDIVSDSPEDSVDLVFEFVHPMTEPHDQVLDDYRRSIELWRAIL